MGKTYSLASDRLILSASSDTLGYVYAAGMFVNNGGKCYVSKWNGIFWTEIGGDNAD